MSESWVLDVLEQPNVLTAQQQAVRETVKTVHQLEIALDSLG